MFQEEEGLADAPQAKKGQVARLTASQAEGSLLQ
jgi:hypothetical protein